jgi:hypothetical protein
MFQQTRKPEFAIESVQEIIFPKNKTGFQFIALTGCSSTRNNRRALRVAHIPVYYHLVLLPSPFIWVKFHFTFVINYRISFWIFLFVTGKN